MYDFSFYFIMVMTFGIIGWIIECIHCSRLKGHFTNRGYLFGPYCPIYGFATLTAYLILYRFKSNLVFLFLLSVLLVFIIEYITSYSMEKIFNARWWDYSLEKYNINGRICLKNGILFGIMSLVFIYYLIPLYISIFNQIPKNILNIISMAMFFAFILDNIISFTMVRKIKDSIKIIKKDSTDEINFKIKRKLFKLF